ncbi:cyclophilin-like fold protein [Propionicimonas sp.]|uniref:cyclophilin-like fold protein n=1 Tax=Propionicimonas sp. TaxID=1955623 RepID=UPI0017D32A13|nr:cyclophilin-like fold protein [Propionicimonas sp.]MBU3977207.1 hypothetical protein [Actinomycetota bacterium]MBA3021133.1 hypothetical protein [Propionicimonas sp.]MBU3985717.1 hypothetical protein [Actinomycetota bacterium]MBU4008502.1 hypothetical protein [Actinomycetota bacterium]MBU4066348.1 hypothetical protein [Actinomycetota bacterium]
MKRLWSAIRTASTTWLVLLAVLATSACAAEVSSAPTPPESEASGLTPITITIGAETYIATLADSPTARDLTAQLPLTLSFKDYNKVEKIAKLRRPLTIEGVPPGADPEINDIGYYSPTNDLVLYYGEVGYWDGIVRIGTIRDGMGSIAQQPDGFTARIALA